MNTTARAAALVATAAVGAVAGAATYAKIDDGSTTTVVRPAAASSATTSTAAVTTSDLSVNQIYRGARDGVVEIIVTSQQGVGGQSQAQGSGWVYDSDGHVITNQHVVDNASSIKIRFANGRSYSATLVGSDASTDLAVLKVAAPASALKPLTVGDSSQLEVGDGVVAIGSPFGLPETVTTGIVSALHREMTSPNNFTIANSIQTDAAINHGNSGGPLLNMHGQVIGVNSQIESDSGGNDGVGFAIPSDAVKSVANTLIAGQTVQHAYLGVQIGDSSSGTGAEVSTVKADTPASKAGLKAGDVITAINGAAVANADDLTAKVNAHKPNQKVTLTVTRSGKSLRIDVTLGVRPS